MAVYSRYSEPQDRELILELRDVVDDWDVFARTNCPRNLDRQKLFVFGKWHDVNPYTTWNDVVSALKEVGLKDDVTKLERKFKDAADSTTGQ